MEVGLNSWTYLYIFVRMDALKQMDAIYVVLFVLPHALE